MTLFLSRFSLITILLFFSFTSNAQMLDSAAYVFGDYIEIGIHKNGHEGAPNIMGDSIHNRGLGGFLFLVS